MADNIELNNWKREFSAGGIVFKKHDDQLLILLIRTSGATAEEKNNVWAFPKGHIDDGETAEQAALREVREEAGIDAKIIQLLGDISYTFFWRGENIHKTVTWYLMEYLSGDHKDHDDEVAETRWVTIQEAESLLTYEADQQNLAKVKQILS